MASVTSLGLHQPTGLQYAIQEQILPDNPSSSSYTWDILVNHSREEEGEDELLVTKHCVIWSRGGIFRKCFGVELEKEPITQALLAHFPTPESLDDVAATNSSKGKRLSKALVVFLKTQCHIFFLNGTSHVVHMPFEVEVACAAPQGVIIQRKQQNNSSVAASLKFPRVPPNSFISNPSPVSMRSSQQSTFTFENVAKPRALPLRLNSALDNMWETPPEKDDSHWPRLIALTDPLLELGLVVQYPQVRSRAGSDKSPQFLDRAEEILHIEEVETAGATQSSQQQKLCLAVTINRETSMYTVWKFSHIPMEDPFVSRQKRPTKAADRRRSSMQPGAPSGINTPLPPSHKESFGSTLPGKRSRKSEKVDKSDKALEKLETSLGLEQEAGGARRTSRRVSSMLARADLSASQDRTAFAEQPQVPSQSGGRRETSHGSHRVRTSGHHATVSFSGAVSQSINSLGSFLEAPVDDLLEELRGGGDFEGFHNMGLDDRDFDSMSQEVLFTKIHSFPVDNSNVRYSLSNQPAKNQSKVFILTRKQSPHSKQAAGNILVCIQDTMEKRLQLLTLYAQAEKHIPGNKPRGYQTGSNVTFSELKRAQNVIDSGKITDGDISAILVLSESTDGRRELSIQAPWSPMTPISLPNTLNIANIRSLDSRSTVTNRDIGIRRVITPSAGQKGLVGIRHPKLRGVVDIVDGDADQLHQIRIQLQPASNQVSKVIQALSEALDSDGERFQAAWWHIMIWLKQQAFEVADPEWSAVVIEIFLVFLALDATGPPSPRPTSPRKKARGFLRSSSGAQVDMGDWDAMNSIEAPNSSGHPNWVDGNPWQWIMEEDEAAASMFHPAQGRDSLDFLTSHTKYALAFMASPQGEDATGVNGYLPTSSANGTDARKTAALNALVALHVISEDQKLDLTYAHSHALGPSELKLVLLQLAKWLGWSDWYHYYELEMPLDFLESQQTDRTITLSFSPPQPELWSAIEWVQVSLTKLNAAELAFASLLTSATPRITLFRRLFDTLSSKGLSPVDLVEAMYQSGITRFVIETLPEAIVVSLKDAIAQCQARPPQTWPNDLLELVGRADIGSILSPLPGKRLQSISVLKPTHVASWDFNSLCQNVLDFNDAPADDAAQSDKQAVIRAIFKDDRRLEEVKSMLNPTKPRAVRLDQQPEWSEPAYLEQQKEIVTRLATNTLSIPAGRGLMNYGLRFPLLTQKFHINGFVLNCTVKPTNVTVGVDKSLFTEEKIAWAFFHSGVAGGLAIARQAKGIDTSWILYNKPGNDLNNRHAGFLLALGLNGHLKGMAKWVAFKYLTPKHAMTSIGLLLGLAASYIGTMDSLITRLLSVHVTRMLPRGAAELNLSPLTQTTGIMGIGLLYSNSQHRRMSEIMMSEIEHVEMEDEEEPLRSECYRLAAGFALGLINLGKGADLKGLHDMRVTEKLLTLASAGRKVEHVHILDRSTAASVVAIALIYMKSDDQIVARKIDVPDAALQFDYVRPDILLLRTVAKHLILWSSIEPSHDWIRKNLPRRYHSRVNPPTHPFDGPGRGPLNSTHLSFLTILAGLCFALGLRYAGSGNHQARDVLLIYLQRFLQLSRSKNAPGVPSNACFDERCVKVTARQCLDVLAVSAAMVMAGTCDVKVLRFLRSLHARNDPETTYGSHLACHMAIGILSLGCGTQTLSTSNLATGALLIAFYPVWPDSVMDNKSHLQAFRHFWVLAVDSRCLVTKDVATNAPISVPISIQRKVKSVKGKGASKTTQEEEIKMTPCLLPPLSEIKKVTTQSPEYWNLELDFEAHPEYLEKLGSGQALQLRRRPVSDSPFAATMLALGRRDASAAFAGQGSAAAGAGNDGTGEVRTSSGAEEPLEWLFDAVPSLQKLTHAERSIVLDRGVGGPDVSESRGSVVDARLVLEKSVYDGKRDELLGLRGLFDWVEWRSKRAEEDRAAAGGASATGSKNSAWTGDGWLRDSVVESLKGEIWLASKN